MSFSPPPLQHTTIHAHLTSCCCYYYYYRPYSMSHIRSRERNRMHAKMTRDRKKSFIATIEKTIEELESSNERMNAVLKDVVRVHNIQKLSMATGLMPKSMSPNEKNELINSRVVPLGVAPNSSPTHESTKTLTVSIPNLASPLPGAPIPESCVVERIHHGFSLKY